MDSKELNALEIAALIVSRLQGEIDPKDEERLESWKTQSESNLKLYNELLDESLRELALNRMGQFDAGAAYERVNRRIERQVISMPKRKARLIRIAAAAILLIVFSAGLYVYHHHSNPQSVAVAKNDVPPGGNKAVLTLANGRKVNVSDIANGMIASQSGVNIRKTNNGQLIYSIAANSPVSRTEYNTITTPNGGQYQVILPDGTKVWLNSASSLRYPTRFEGNERMVSLTGEGYFEVAHNAAMPFIVNSPGQEVKVLGTHFNIKSYPGEAVVTTLLEGSVKIESSQDRIAKEYILKPGQQALSVNGQINIGPADIAESTAWKDGQFIFHNTDLTAIMREAQRWYDVRVDLNNLPDERYNGAISRNVPLSQLLQMLEVTSNIKFRISERRIMLQK